MLEPNLPCKNYSVYYHFLKPIGSVCIRKNPQQLSFKLLNLTPCYFVDFCVFIASGLVCEACIKEISVRLPLLAIYILVIL
jgi:hypothetical protein